MGAETRVVRRWAGGRPEEEEDWGWGTRYVRSIRWEEDSVSRYASLRSRAGGGDIPLQVARACHCASQARCLCVLRVRYGPVDGSGDEAELTSQLGCLMRLC